MLLMMMQRKLLVELKEEELRKSKNIYDRAYVGRWLDGKSVKQISRDLAYCKTQVYEILKTNQKYDDRVNKVASVIKDDIYLLKYINIIGGINHGREKKRSDCRGFREYSLCGGNKCA